MQTRGAVLLENHLGRVDHPTFLRFGADLLAHVEDPTVEPIRAGHLAFGWEGDQRLGLYVNARRARWELCRLEADGSYRSILRVPDTMSATDLVGFVVGWLVTHDVRRGYDPLDEIVAHEKAKERAEDSAWADESLQLADQLHHSLLKDIGHLEGGTRRQHTAPDVSHLPATAGTA